MVEATRVFAEVNELVRSQERRLRHELHVDTLADSLTALQKAEEAKLRFTLIQQVCLGRLQRLQGLICPLDPYQSITWHDAEAPLNQCIGKLTQPPGQASCF